MRKRCHKSPELTAFPRIDGLFRLSGERRNCPTTGEARHRRRARKGHTWGWSHDRHVPDASAGAANGAPAAAGFQVRPNRGDPSARRRRTGVADRLMPTAKEGHGQWHRTFVRRAVRPFVCVRQPGARSFRLCCRCRSACRQYSQHNRNDRRVLPFLGDTEVVISLGKGTRVVYRGQQLHRPGYGAALQLLRLAP